jgi:hypothetical protein
MLHRIAPLFTGAVCGALVAAAIVMTGPEASARSAYESTYGYDRTWNAALRLVRVDLGFKITEKDEGTGYLMFDYKSPEAHGASPGSIEFIHSKDPQAPVRVVVQLAQMPRYHEQVLVDALARKLHQEYGDPPPVVRAKEIADAGEDAAQ